MPNGIFCELWDMMKDFSYLLFFDLYLLFIGDGEPSTSSIDLKMLWERCFKRGLLDDIEYLSFDTIRAIFYHADIDDTSWDSSSRNQDFFARSWVYAKSGSSEYELIYGDIWNNLIFLHEERSVYKIISFLLCFAWGSEKFSSLS